MEDEINISIDHEKFAADAAWDGIKGYVTNTRLSAQKVIDNYSNLWYIERAFRMNKTDLRIRLLYHHLRNRIEGHICICFTAYTILLEMERMLKHAKAKINLHKDTRIDKKHVPIDLSLV
jgi:transposase